MTLTDIGNDTAIDTNTARLNSASDDSQALKVEPAVPSSTQADTWVFQLDLGAHGIAIDLTDPDWPRQMDQGLVELAPLLPTELAPDRGQTAAQTSQDTSDDRSEDTSDDATASPVMGASVRAFVSARTAELVDQGAVSILLLPTGSALAPVAVGAVFVQHLRSGTAALFTAPLEADGWAVTAISAQPVPSPNSVLRGRRSIAIPGVAGLVLNEQLTMLGNDDSVVTVLFQGASSESSEDLSDSVILAAVTSARLEKN